MRYSAIQYMRSVVSCDVIWCIAMGCRAIRCEMKSLDTADVAMSAELPECTAQQISLRVASSSQWPERRKITSETNNLSDKYSSGQFSVM